MILNPIQFYIVYILLINLNIIVIAQMDISQKTLGFVGTGKIGSAVARGYARCNPPPKKIYVSPRSKDKAEALLAEFPDLICIVENDQVVEKSDIIFWGLLPDVARSILPTLPFREDQYIISMMAAIDYSETISLANGKTPSSNIVRTVPLPSAAKRSGPILMHPPNTNAEAILNNVGTTVSCKEENEMKPMICLTGHISPFFELERVSQEFMVRNGVNSDTAKAFVASFYSSLANASANTEDSFAELRDEAATPGGLNEQSVNRLVDSEHYKLHDQSMQSILDRLQGKK